jgi:hypothetical protein
LYNELIEVVVPSETVLTNCTKLPEFYVWIDSHINGSLVIPGLVNVGQAVFQGMSSRSPITSAPIPAEPSNLTSLDLPDLVNVALGFVMDSMDKLQGLKVPKLRKIGDEMRIDLTGGPAIKLSFPNLVSVSNIYLNGPIDT